MPGRRDFDRLAGSIMGGEAGTSAHNASAARRVLRSVSAADEVCIDRASGELGGINVSTAFDAMNVGRVFLWCGSPFYGLSLALGESFFSFHH